MNHTPPSLLRQSWLSSSVVRVSLFILTQHSMLQRMAPQSTQLVPASLLVACRGGLCWVTQETLSHLGSQQYVC